VTDAGARNLYSVSIGGDPVAGGVLLENWNLLDGDAGKVSGAVIGRLGIQPQAVPGVVIGLLRGREMARNHYYGLGPVELPCRVSVIQQPDAGDGEIEVRLGGTTFEPRLLLRNLIKPLGVEESVEMDLVMAAEVATLLLKGLEGFPEDWESWAGAQRQCALPEFNS
jgi:hypothetical protein